MTRKKQQLANLVVLQRMLQDLLSGTRPENSPWLRWLEVARIGWALDAQRLFAMSLWLGTFLLSSPLFARTSSLQLDSLYTRQNCSLSAGSKWFVWCCYDGRVERSSARTLLEMHAQSGGVKWPVKVLGIFSRVIDIDWYANWNRSNDRRSIEIRCFLTTLSKHFIKGIARATGQKSLRLVMVVVFGTWTIVARISQNKQAKFNVKACLAFSKCFLHLKHSKD